MTTSDYHLIIILFSLMLCCNVAMKRKYPAWYKTVGLKHVTGFLTAVEKQKLKKIARDADKSLARYVTRLLQQHIREVEEDKKAE